MHQRKWSILMRSLQGLPTIKIDQNTKIHENVLIEDSLNFMAIIRCLKVGIGEAYDVITMTSRCDFEAILRAH